MGLLWARLAWDGGPGEVWGNQVWRVALWPPRQTQQRTVALQSPPFLRLAPLPPFSPRPPFSDVKIYKGAHRVHFATCIHKQSVSFLSQKHGVPSEREKTFLADIMYTNAHRRPPVPAKNRCYGGHFSFFFLSLIWKHVYCTWEKNAPSKLDRLLRARESCAGPAWQTLARPVSHSCFYLSKIINRPGEKPRLWLFQHNAVKFKCERLSGWISGVLCLLMEGRSWGILVWILHVREPQTLKLPWRCERVCWPCDSLMRDAPPALNSGVEKGWRVKLTFLSPTYVQNRIFMKTKKAKCCPCDEPRHASTRQTTPRAGVSFFLAERWACFVVRLVPAWSYCETKNRIPSRNSQAAFFSSKTLTPAGNWSGLMPHCRVCIHVQKSVQTAWRVWWCDTVAVGACGATPGSVSLVL